MSPRLPTEAAGGLIVLITGIFLSAWVFAPRHGLVSRRAGRRAAEVTARR